MIRGARAAFTFLTRVPVGGFPYDDTAWKWSSGWFPFVGTAIGLGAAAIWWLTEPGGPWVAAMSALVFSMLLTGGFHEDGLADSADALGGAYDRESLFRILKDSRVGAFGALALVVSVAFRLVLLARLDGMAPVGLVLMHTLARVGPVCLMVLLPYVTDDEAARSRRVTRAGPPQALLASVTGMGVLVSAGALGSVSTGSLFAVTAVCVGMTALAGWRFFVRAGGVTGDFLGATEQLCEIAVLLAMVLAGAAPLA